MANPSFLAKNSAPYLGYIVLIISLIFLGVRFVLGWPICAFQAHSCEQYLFLWPFALSIIFGLNIVPQTGHGTFFRIRALFRHAGEQKSKCPTDEGNNFLTNGLEQYLQVNSFNIFASKIKHPFSAGCLMLSHEKATPKGCDLIIAPGQYLSNYPFRVTPIL